MIRVAAIALAALLALPAAAAELPLPAGVQPLAERISKLAAYQLPTGVFANGAVPLARIEGRVVRRSWRVAVDASPLQIAAPVRDALEAAGYDIVFECSDRDCGGFDFRFAIEIIPAPDMTVDLDNFVFLSARKGGGAAVSLLVSHSISTAYIQLIEVSPPEAQSTLGVVAQPSPAAVPSVPPSVPGTDGLAAAFQEQGRVVLSDLEFETGSSRLGEGDFTSLAALAAFLTGNPEARVLLVGHTDSEGSLAANTAVSQRRAEAVRDRPAERHSVPADRLEVAGAGYLAPLASNLTEEGRETNRRVEAVLLSQ